MLAVLLMSLPLAAAGPTSVPISLKIDVGELEGEVDLPAGAGPFPVAVLIPGSGPTDRDGNQPNLKGDSLKQLGRQCAERGLAVVRFDRRGIGAGRALKVAERDLRIETSVGDVAAWVTQLKADPRFNRVVVMGHSEGSLVGMLAARQANADAFVSLAAPGRPLGDVLRTQLQGKLPKELAEKSDTILKELEAGREVEDVPPPLAPLYRASVQPYLISLLKVNPAAEIARLKVPVLIVQGTTDVQTPTEEGHKLAQALPTAKLVVIEGMNHALKPATTPAEQTAAYTDPKTEIVPRVAEEIVAFLKANAGPRR